MSRPKGDDAPYEGVRRMLLERGYLEGPIERFVLAELLRAGFGLAPLLRVAAKAAAVGGPLLGALLAWAAAAANWPLLGAADLALLWLYFGLLGTVVLFALDLAAASAAVLVARRRGARRADTLVAALLVAVPTLAYLLLLWWARRPGAGLWGDLVFLVAALGIALLVAWLAGLVSLAGIIGRTGQVPDRGRKAALTAVLALLPLCLALLVARAAPAGTRSRVDPSPFAVAEGSERLVLLGVDGLDRSLLEALGPRGTVHRLQGAIERGALFALEHDPGMEPPEVWTTLLTGMPATEHGVTSAGAERLPGVATPLRRGGGPLPLDGALRLLLPTRTVPMSGAGRRVRTLWEIVALRQPAVAVGWWASWPAGDSAAAGGGYEVTDRALPKLLSGARGDRDTTPESLYPRLQSDFERDRASLRKGFVAAFPGAAAGRHERWLWESFLIDAYSWRIAERLMSDPAVRAAFVYLPGLDILRHKLAPREGVRLNDLLDTQHALESYVGWLDGLVGQAFDRAEQGVLVADPGRDAGQGGEGFVLVLGPGTPTGCRGTPLRPVDLAPLVLGRLGYPQSAEMLGSAPAQCLGEAEAPVQRIASYGRKEVPADPPISGDDEEMVRRLRSLGYLN